MSEKHLITSGCSFTAHDGTERDNYNISWAENLFRLMPEQYWPMSFHNLAISGVGNYIISLNTIDVVENLLNSGVDNNDIYVFVQWSGLFRPTLHSRTGEKVVKFNEQKTGKSSLVGLDKSNGYYFNSAARTGTKFWTKFYDSYFNESFAFLETLNLILKTQWYLKSKSVKYKMFTAWDIFTSGEYSGTLGKDKILNTNQFGNVIYNNQQNVFLKDHYQYSKHLWNMIDWDNFWTFNNDNVKFGGMLQWVQNNTDFKNWYVNYGKDFHVPSQTSLMFTEKIILTLLTKMIEKNK